MVNGGPLYESDYRYLYINHHSDISVTVLIAERKHMGVLQGLVIVTVSVLIAVSVAGGKATNMRCS